MSAKIPVKAKGEQQPAKVMACGGGPDEVPEGAFEEAERELTAPK